MMHLEAFEDYISVPGGRIWYRIVGRKEASPLVLLHGGPGFPHDYLEPLEGLAEFRPVVTYDQLGCGRSDRPSDTSLWHVERFVQELRSLHKSLGCPRIHLLGHSWGSILAVEYVLRYPEQVHGLILASPALSIPRFAADTAKLLEELPPEIIEVISHHQAAGTTDSEEYQAAAFEFSKRYICRQVPWPEILSRTFAAAGWESYLIMQGPSEFYITGSLKDYDITSRLTEIRTPTLLTCGRHDETPPLTVEWYKSLISNSDIRIFENSAHMAHIEEPESFLSTVSSFLAKTESLGNLPVSSHH